MLSKFDFFNLVTDHLLLLGEGLSFQQLKTRFFSDKVTAFIFGNH